MQERLKEVLRLTIGLGLLITDALITLYCRFEFALC